ncbi:amino acid ABC transporter permease [Hoeflea prorocentri]|uniref:Amino acid ABC transporter permease n=1 Tax=Hoeflea prorocentri TaxID=1922333 RepID=A0A9X3ZH06_9HYPH|nr:amino acid ABC transporter permease [Hoeflea prorocentri]MCY6380386.1 amino acid ABC transporter permease [Hoeflea prorocentri]MDA5398186.1 amino acid ABC transporter permease [Hoeflea prorocentri]
MAQTSHDTSIAFVREEMVDASAAPVRDIGAIAWLRSNLFSTWYYTLLTLLVLYALYLVIPPLFRFAFVDAVWTGTDRAACTTIGQGGVQEEGWFGACWTYVGAYFNQFIYGRYPDAEQWRVNIVYVMLFGGLAPLLIPSAPFKGANILFMTIIFPVASFILLTGGNLHYGGFLLPELFTDNATVRFWIDYLVVTLVLMAIGYGIARGTDSNPNPIIFSILAIMGGLAVVLLLFAVPFGLETVETDRWGGLLVTLVIAVTGIAVSLPIGIGLALGRRSNMPIVKLFSVIFIEFWRGVPLITVLFMASVMLPLFLPEGTHFDKLLRALIGVAMFSAAYMAEVVRGGLQAIPKGQYEGAMALGLSFWQMMRMIILPQALTLVIPGIVNTFIGLFKDTTLVLIIGLFDFLGQIQASFSDPKWASPGQALTGYLFAAFVYFWFCFGMSRYSQYMERRLDTGHKS